VYIPRPKPPHSGVPVKVCTKNLAPGEVSVYIPGMCGRTSADQCPTWRRWGHTWRRSVFLRRTCAANLPPTASNGAGAHTFFGPAPNGESPATENIRTCDGTKLHLERNMSSPATLPGQHHSWCPLLLQPTFDIDPETPLPGPMNPLFPRRGGGDEGRRRRRWGSGHIAGYRNP